MSLTPEEKAAMVKAAIKKAFALSPEPYDKFEARWGLFADLTRRLIAAMDLSSSDRVIDVGCGSGASCRPLISALPQGEIVGLDISPEMIDAAQRFLGDYPNVTLVVGDAARLDEHLTGKFDAALYTASAFLIPDLARSLDSALKVLKPGGKIGLTFMVGLYDGQGADLLRLAEQEAQTGANFKRAIYLEQAVRVFEERIRDVSHLTHDLELPRQAMRQFYSIPAQSAGVYPNSNYDQRQANLDKLFYHMPEQILFRWQIMIGCSAARA